MEKIEYLKGKETFFISLFLIFFSIIAFVPFVLLLIVRNIFGSIAVYKKQIQIDSFKYIPARLERIYE